ncbi:proton-coupled amino acid transporter-like protein CG1139 [Lutzomyia longipalpis]|uniref:proton-coupled amino acid transporter-like protein CG1139 n=1 Tax=Lutzomyia longipalpis TaxID=7200 RepID=UPI002484643D|nr:proton-coupled amino acid transporter-like protein CG1139 [Lutzomyia longipalpis]
MSAEEHDPKDAEEGTVEENYDPHEHREVGRGISNVAAFVHILKGTIGTGILAMPNAIKNSGYIMGPIVIIPISVLVVACVHMIMDARYNICKKHRTPNMTYSESIRNCLKEGPPFAKSVSGASGHVANVIFFFAQMGTCVAYVAFIAESLKKILDHEEIYIDVRIYMFIIGFPLTLINLIRDLKRLAPFSMIANAFIIAGIAFILFYVFRDGLSGEDREMVSKPAGWPLYLGTVFFAFQSLGVVIPVEYKMKEPKKFSGLCGIMNTAFILIASLYTFFGICGYIKYGSASKGSITLNLPQDEMFATVISVLYVLSIFLSHPLQANFPLEIAINYAKDHISEESPKFRTVECIIRIAFVWLSVVFAIAIPNLGLIISISGAFSTSLTAFIIPAIMEMCLKYGEYGFKCNYYLFRDIFVIIIGFIALALGLYVAIRDI